jgi:hypothetical protein
VVADDPDEPAERQTERLLAQLTFPVSLLDAGCAVDEARANARQASRDQQPGGRGSGLSCGSRVQT